MLTTAPQPVKMMMEVEPTRPKIIIMAGGDGARWGNFLGVPKQLISVEGETLLMRAIRLCLKNGAKWDDIVVLAPRELSKKDRWHFYNAAGMAPIVPAPLNSTGVDKFYNGLPLWDQEAIYLYGDVYFTEEAMATIYNTRPDPGSFLAFGRQHGNGRKEYGELFAYRSRNKPALTAALEHLRKINAIGGWQLYRYRAGKDLHEHEVDQHFVEINDMTDDFDSPEEYIAWIKEAQKTLWTNTK